MVFQRGARDNRQELALSPDEPKSEPDRRRVNKDRDRPPDFLILVVNFPTVFESRFADRQFMHSEDYGHDRDKH